MFHLARAVLALDADDHVRDATCDAVDRHRFADQSARASDLPALDVGVVD